MCFSLSLGGLAPPRCPLTPSHQWWDSRVHLMRSRPRDQDPSNPWDPWDPWDLSDLWDLWDLLGLARLDHLEGQGQMSAAQGQIHK